MTTTINNNNNDDNNNNDNNNNDNDNDHNNNDDDVLEAQASPPEDVLAATSSRCSTPRNGASVPFPPACHLMRPSYDAFGVPFFKYGSKRKLPEPTAACGGHRSRKVTVTSKIEARPRGKTDPSSSSDLAQAVGVGTRQTRPARGERRPFQKRRKKEVVVRW